MCPELDTLPPSAFQDLGGLLIAKSPVVPTLRWRTVRPVLDSFPNVPMRLTAQALKSHVLPPVLPTGENFSLGRGYPPDELLMSTSYLSVWRCSA